MNSKVSPNRKYQQLSLHDAQRLLCVYRVGYSALPIHTVRDARNLSALEELVQKAEATPDARICLAHAAIRGRR